MAGVPMLIPKWILKKIGFTGTTSEVNAAIASGRIQEGDTVIITDDEGGGTISASAISYNNSSSGMSATAVQGAIDELNADLTDKLSGVYSTSEEKVGEAFGSDLYRKCYVISNPTNSTIDATLTSSYVKELVNISGSVTKNTGEIYPLPHPQISSDIISSGLVYYNGISGATITKLVMIVEYTKN